MTDPLVSACGVDEAGLIRLVGALGAAGRTVATAESLTGGLIAAVLTAVPGASAVVRGGLVVYATDLKHTLAGVDRTLLAEVGAVDPEVARQLATGARERCGAALGVGVTGVAGPDPQDGTAVGTVFVCVDAADGRWESAARFEGDRAAIRAASVRRALELLTAAAAPDTEGDRNSARS
ncbi:CinA family protein [Nakamurella deserti]|uniref:CinA family protein n=1 Tax=Nakamurella deserti TaxID=2164074 RepID=UPI00197C6CA0|nr:CinA family protein [Nakamurella deserti]